MCDACISGQWKIERWINSVNKILNKYGGKHFSFLSASFDVIEKLAVLQESKEVINKKLSGLKNDTLRVRLLMLLMDMEARRPIVTGILTRERMLELTTTHDGDRLLKKPNLRTLLKKWYPAVFTPVCTDYRDSMLRLFGHKVVAHNKELSVDATANSTNAIPFLFIGLILGFIVGRS